MSNNTPTVNGLHHQITPHNNLPEPLPHVPPANSSHLPLPQPIHGLDFIQLSTSLHASATDVDYSPSMGEHDSETLNSLHLRHQHEQQRREQWRTGQTRNDTAIARNCDQKFNTQARNTGNVPIQQADGIQNGSTEQNNIANTNNDQQENIEDEDESESENVEFEQQQNITLQARFTNDGAPRFKTIRINFAADQSTPKDGINGMGDDQQSLTDPTRFNPASLRHQASFPHSLHSPLPPPPVTPNLTQTGVATDNHSNSDNSNDNVSQHPTQRSPPTSTLLSARFNPQITSSSGPNPIDNNSSSNSHSVSTQLNNPTTESVPTHQGQTSSQIQSESPFIPTSIQPSTQSSMNDASINNASSIPMNDVHGLQPPRIDNQPQRRHIADESHSSTNNTPMHDSPIQPQSNARVSSDGQSDGEKEASNNNPQAQNLVKLLTPFGTVTTTTCLDPITPLSPLTTHHQSLLPPTTMRDRSPQRSNRSTTTMTDHTSPPQSEESNADHPSLRQPDESNSDHPTPLYHLPRSITDLSLPIDPALEIPQQVIDLQPFWAHYNKKSNAIPYLSYLSTQLRFDYANYPNLPQYQQVQNVCDQYFVTTSHPLSFDELYFLYLSASNSMNICIICHASIGSQSRIFHLNQHIRYYSQLTIPLTVSNMTTELPHRDPTLSCPTCRVAFEPATGDLAMHPKTNSHIVISGLTNPRLIQMYENSLRPDLLALIPNAFLLAHRLSPIKFQIDSKEYFNTNKLTYIPTPFIDQASLYLHAKLITPQIAVFLLRQIRQTTDFFGLTLSKEQIMHSSDFSLRRFLPFFHTHQKKKKTADRKVHPNGLLCLVCLQIITAAHLPHFYNHFRYIIFNFGNVDIPNGQQVYVPCHTCKTCFAPTLAKEDSCHNNLHSAYTSSSPYPNIDLNPSQLTELQTTCDNFFNANLLLSGLGPELPTFFQHLLSTRFFPFFEKSIPVLMKAMHDLCPHLDFPSTPSELILQQCRETLNIPPSDPNEPIFYPSRTNYTSHVPIFSWFDYQNDCLIDALVDQQRLDAAGYLQDWLQRQPQPKLIRSKIWKDSNQHDSNQTDISDSDNSSSTTTDHDPNDESGLDFETARAILMRPYRRRAGVDMDLMCGAADPNTGSLSTSATAIATPLTAAQRLQRRRQSVFENAQKERGRLEKQDGLMEMIDGGQVVESVVEEVVDRNQPPHPPHQFDVYECQTPTVQQEEQKQQSKQRQQQSQHPQHLQHLQQLQQRSRVLNSKHRGRIGQYLMNDQQFPSLLQPGYLSPSSYLSHRPESTQRPGEYQRNRLGEFQRKLSISLPTQSQVIVNLPSPHLINNLFVPHLHAHLRSGIEPIQLPQLLVQSQPNRNNNLILQNLLNTANPVPTKWILPTSTPTTPVADQIQQDHDAVRQVDKSAGHFA